MLGFFLEGGGSIEKIGKKREGELDREREREDSIQRGREMTEGLSVIVFLLELLEREGRD